MKTKLKVPSTVASAKPPKKQPAPPAKKAAPAKKTSSKGLTVAGQAIPGDVVQEWKDGGRMSELASKHGVKRGALKRAIIKAVGGKVAFKKLRDDGAGGQMELFGGKRAEGGAKTWDDSKAIVTRYTDKDNKKWKGGSVQVPSGHSYESRPTITSPKGVTYILAQANERADMVYHGRHASSLGPLRFKLYEQSSAKKKLEGMKEAIAAGVKKHQAKRAAKRAAKLMRKKTKKGAK